VTAWLLLATGHKDEAMAKMAAAADAEDKTEKSPVTPGPLAPARELYGAMLLQQGKAVEALVAFEATLRKEPNRLNAFLGAAAAASAAGDSAKARQYFSAAAKQASDASVERTDVIKARALAAAK
jgi:tetratricopeptide (TPR) repeat protein